MEEQNESISNNMSIGSEGGTTIGGDVTGGDKITIVNNDITHNYYVGDSGSSSNDASDDERKLRLTVHLAVFESSNVPCYFINATNLSKRDIEITHIWFACDPQIHALQPERKLPKRLIPDETWETWVEAYKLTGISDEPFTLARARLSTGQVVQSQPNENIPARGFIPGGPVSGGSSASSKF